MLKYVIIKHEKRAMRQHDSLTVQTPFKMVTALYEIKNHSFLAAQAYEWFLFFVIFTVHDCYD